MENAWKLAIFFAHAYDLCLNRGGNSYPSSPAWTSCSSYFVDRISSAIWQKWSPLLCTWPSSLPDRLVLMWNPSKMWMQASECRLTLLSSMFRILIIYSQFLSMIACIPVHDLQDAKIEV